MRFYFFEYLNTGKSNSWRAGEFARATLNSPKSLIWRGLVLREWSENSR